MQIVTEADVYEMLNDPGDDDEFLGLEVLFDLNADQDDDNASVQVRNFLYAYLLTFLLLFSSVLTYVLLKDTFVWL